MAIRPRTCAGAPVQTAPERSCGPRLMSCSPAVAWLCERRPLWRLLCETAARASEVLGLDVDDLDLRNRRARVRRKGGAVDIIVWQTGSARLLPRLLEGRRTGPVFLTGRRARVPLAPGDVDPSSGKARLSYRRAAELFEAATKGATLHQLRHFSPNPRRRGGRQHLYPARLLGAHFGCQPRPICPGVA